jgi:hypothetical protein
MLADLSSVYMLSNIITGAVGTLTLMVTLGIVAWQTTHTAKQTKLNTIVSYFEYLKDVNIMLLEHTELSQRIVGDTKEDAIATIALITLELSFKLHQQRLVGSSWWQGDREMAVGLMKKGPLRLHWERTKHIYDHEFVEFIDNLLQELDGQQQMILPADSETEKNEIK